jgi:hypothetical protein
MPPIKPFVFISCGQYLPHEKQLGLEIKKAIEELTPFDAYFAEDQSSTNGLVANILERLYHCAGKDGVILPDLCSKLPNWRLSATAAIKTQRWERWEEEMHRLRPENIEALRILTLDGPANDAAVMPRLKRMGLAQNWYVVLPGLTTNSPFVQVVPGQPPAHRQRDDERMYEIKSEAKEFLEHYFGEHPQKLWMEMGIKPITYASASILRISAERHRSPAVSLVSPLAELVAQMRSVHFSSFE